MFQVIKADIEFIILTTVLQNEDPVAMPEYGVVTKKVDHIFSLYKEGKIVNWFDFARVTGAHLAIDTRRQAESRRKTLVSAMNECKKNKEKRSEENKKEIIRMKFERFVAAQKEKLPPGVAILRMTCFESMPDEQISSIFPNTSPGLRYQWKRRAIKWLLSRMPETCSLARFLANKKNTHTGTVCASL